MKGTDMQRYRRGRRPAAILIALLLATNVAPVLLSRPGSVPVIASAIASALAMVLVAVRTIMSGHPARDCAAVAACAAALAVDASSSSGIMLVVTVASVVIVIALATVLLFISADAAANEARPRFRR